MNPVCHTYAFKRIVRWALCLLPIASPTWAAELLSSYSYDSFYGASGQGTQFDTGSDSTNTAQPLAHTSTVAPAALSLFVQSDFGVHKGSITSARFGGGTEPLQGGGGQANSRWVDTFQLSGGTGSATAIYQMRIDGSLSFSALSSLPLAQVDLRARSNAFEGVVYRRSIGRGTDQETWSGTSYVDGILQREFEFTYGIPFTIQSDLLVNGQDGGIATFASTILAGFILPAGAVLASESGAQYPSLSPIPEPPTWLLCIASFGFFIARIREKRSIQLNHVDA